MCYTSFPNNLQALEHLHTQCVGFIIGVMSLTGVFCYEFKPPSLHFSPVFPDLCSLVERRWLQSLMTERTYG